MVLGGLLLHSTCLGEIRVLSGGPLHKYINSTFVGRPAGTGSVTEDGLVDVEREAEDTLPFYAEVITARPVQRFLHRYLVGGEAMADNTRVYVITREPQADYHHAGVALLKQWPLVEIRYNPDIHAKLYLVWRREESDSFALFGSGNLTESGLRHNIELGMMISARGRGRAIVRELYQWASVTLRSRSKRVKAITWSR